MCCYTVKKLLTHWLTVEHCTQSAHWTHERCFKTSVDCSTTTAYKQWTEIWMHSHLYGSSSSWKPSLYHSLASLSVEITLAKALQFQSEFVDVLDRRRTANSITDHLEKMALWAPTTCSGNGNTDFLVTCTYSTEWNCRVYKNFATLQFLATDSCRYVVSIQQESTAAVTGSRLSAMSVSSSNRLLCSMLEPSTAEQRHPNQMVVWMNIPLTCWNTTCFRLLTVNIFISPPSCDCLWPIPQSGLEVFTQRIKHGKVRQVSVKLK